MNRTSLALLVACLLSSGASARTWTDSQGRKIEGDYVRMADDAHVIVRKDGKELTLEVAKLGDADRQWLEGQEAVIAKRPATTALTHAIRIEDVAPALKSITPELVNQPDLGGYHPLTYAAYTGKPELVDALLKGGANPNVVEQDGTTALFVAALHDQPEMIRALKKHGAKYPARDLHRQPVGAAVRAEALESLKVLFELYPDLDPNAGWPWPASSWEENRVQEGDEISPYYARSSLLFATYAGYDGIARELLAHGTDVRTNNTFGQGPLHRAAANPLISTEVVAALINRGADPFRVSFAEHFSPRTPLDFAAAAGSIEKVRLLTKGQDSKKHASVYRQAAMLAAAAGKRDVMVFLFRELGEVPPKLEQVIARSTQSHPAGPDEHQSMVPVNAVDEPLPAIRPDPKNKPAAPGSVAVIASRSLGNHAALLTNALSSIDGLSLVERDDLGDAASEKLLQKLSGQNQDAEGLDLALVPADQLVFLWEVEISGRRFIKVTLLSVATRATVLRQVLEFAEPDEAWVKNRLAPLLDAVRQGQKRTEEKATAVSLIPLTPVNRTRECLEFVRYANLMLPGRVLREPGVTLLTLRQMQPLEAENALTGQDSYWKAAWVIEGSLSTVSADEVSLVLSASPPGQARRTEVTVRGQTRELAGTLDRAWKELTAKLDLKANDAPAAASPPGAAADEGKSVAQQARWFLEAKYPRDAFDLANAAYILGCRDQELLRTMTEAAIDRLSIQQRFGCDHVRKDPRVIDPAVRLSHASSLPEFLALCDCARLYVAGLKEQLISPVRPWGRTRSSNYNEIVSHALAELQFYRRMMGDCLAEDRYGRELEQLDREIASLTREYLERCRGHASEMDTLRNLLFRNFYIGQAPGPMEAIFDRMMELSRQKPADTALSNLLDRLGDWCGDPEHACSSEDPLRAFAMKLAGSDAVIQAWPLQVAKLKAACATTRTSRIQSLRQMMAISTDPERSRYSLGNQRHEWERFFDCTERSGDVYLLEKCHLLGAGGISRLITKPPGNFTSTGEFARMAGWYYDLLRWPRMEASAREKLVLGQVDTIASRAAKDRPAPAQLAAIRDHLRAENLLTPKEAEAFAKLAPDSAKPGPATAEDSSLALAHLLTLPEKAGMAQFARVTQAALDKDQLWLPATYFESGGDVRNVETPPRCHHVIHVIQLRDRTVRTIELPKEEDLDEKWARPSQTAPIDPSIVRPVLLGEKHAYFLKSPRPGRLYAIDRQTLEVSSVELPLPNVIAMSYRTRGDTLYLSVANQWQPMLGEGRFDATAVIAVTGKTITETLVSNQRKPAQMPLDQPDTWVDLIQVADHRLVLISNKDASYIHTESLKAAARAWNANTWTNVPAGELNKVRGYWNAGYTERFLTHRNLTVDNNKVFITEDPYDGEVPAAIALVKDANAAMDFRASWLTQPSKAGKFRKIPVVAKPVEDPQMSRKMFALRIPPEERKSSGERYRTATANDVLKEGGYNVRVLGKWQDQYLVFLAGETTVSMPAIWTMSEAEFRQQVSKVLPW
jgi:ankyrin repeat protein